MLTVQKTASPELNKDLQVATFMIGNMLLGIDIQKVQEINRHLETTRVPHAPTCVRGVINLRGEVVTVVDLRSVLGLLQSETTADSRSTPELDQDRRRR